MNKRRSKKKSTMTLELEKETLAELKATAIIFGAKSYSSLVHQQVVLKIREAKQLVSRDEFEKLFREQLEELNIRSKAKSLERKNALQPGKIAEDEDDQNFKDEKTGKSSAAKKPGKGGKTFSTRSKTISLINEAPSINDDDE